MNQTKLSFLLHRVLKVRQDHVAPRDNKDHKGNVDQMDPPENRAVQEVMLNEVLQVLREHVEMMVNRDQLETKEDQERMVLEDLLVAQVIIIYHNFLQMYFL